MFNHIHIFGARGMGRWFAEKIFINTERNLTIYDIDIPKNPPFPQYINTVEISFIDNKLVNEIHFEKEDLIVLAIPVHNLNSLCNALLNRIPKGCLIVDFSSVKIETHTILEKYFGSRRIPFLGAHLLFAPALKSPVGLNLQFPVACYRDIILS